MIDRILGEVLCDESPSNELTAALVKTLMMSWEGACAGRGGGGGGGFRVVLFGPLSQWMDSVTPVRTASLRGESQTRGLVVKMAVFWAVVPCSLA